MICGPGNSSVAASRNNESHLMDSLTPASPVAVSPEIPDQRPPRVWKFWGTALWGLFIFAAMFLGQVAVIVYFVLRQGGAFDVAQAIRVVGGGLTISLSVIMGLPAVLLATWIAIRPTRMSFTDYLALRWTSWRNFFDRRRRRWPSWSAAGTCCRGRSGAR